jgi:predicted O-methyltransferase YrrM
MKGNEMDDATNLNPPAELRDLLAVTQTMGFGLSSDMLTGSLLRTMAASKPAGQVLELGTGAGAGACWLLDGMDAASRLHTVDIAEGNVAVAKQFLGNDKRVTFYIEDGGAAILRMKSYGMKFDLIFADTMPGKYTHLDDALALLKAGGLYVIDDLLPQPTWPEGHAEKVPALIAALEARKDLRITKLNWSTGLILATKIF